MIVPDLIYDVGMHVGNDTASYLGEGYRVIGIEANPILVEHCRHRFANALAAGTLRILPVGIAESSGVMPFYINPRNDEWSHFNKEIAWRDGQEGPVVDVPTVRFEDILAQIGKPYFIKSDIETSDIHVLNGLKSLAKEDLPYYLSVEAHKIEYLVIMRTLGYEKYKIVDQKAHGVLAWSGPFGEKAPGQWISMDDMVYEWLHFTKGLRDRLTIITKDPGTWIDVHAKRTW